MERFLKEHPGCRSLRAALEGMVLLNREFRRFQRKYPTVDIEELFGVPKAP